MNFSIRNTASGPARGGICRNSTQGSGWRTDHSKGPLSDEQVRDFDHLRRGHGDPVLGA